MQAYSTKTESNLTNSKSNNAINIGNSNGNNNANGTTTATPRKEIIAIKKVNYESPRLSNLIYSSNGSSTLTANTASLKHSQQSKSNSHNNKQQSTLAHNQDSIDLDYLTRKLKQFQMMPKCSSPIPSPPPILKKSPSTQIVSKKHQHTSESSNKQTQAKSTKSLHRSSSNMENHNPLYLDLTKLDYPTHRGVSKSSQKPNNNHYNHHHSNNNNNNHHHHHHNQNYTQRRQEVDFQKSQSAREKINRSQSQLSYREQSASTHRDGINKIYYVDKMYDSEFLNLNTGTMRVNRSNSNTANNIGNKMSIKKSKSSHVFNSYSPKSSVYSDSNSNTPISYSSTESTSPSSVGSRSQSRSRTPSRSCTPSDERSTKTKSYHHQNNYHYHHHNSYYNNQHQLKTDAAETPKMKYRRSSVNNFITPRSIVIRREKSVSLQTNQPSTHQQTLYSKQDLPLMKQTLMANILSNNNNQNNNELTNRETSSTTSGIDTSCKNSTTFNVESVNYNEAANVYITKINELKNRLFVLEIELANEKKKLSIEKDSKAKMLSEMKLRYETEKMAALKALEAKLNAEKLFELNKLKELIESERRDEIDVTQKSYDSELINLKLKLRDKTDKCIQLEKLLKEECNKNSKFYLKSMEVVRKYNQELKMMNDDNNSKVKSFKEKSNGLKSTETQTLLQSQGDVNANKQDIYMECGLDLNALKAKILTLKQILEENCNPTKDTPDSEEPNTRAATKTNENVKNSSPFTINFDSLLSSLTNMAKDLKFDQQVKASEIKHLKGQHAKLAIDYKLLKESKCKLESLYKIKCKSDLNKSAQIKKLEINYQIELIKLRNEFNSDLVRYLETKLVKKESLINENFNFLNNVLISIGDFKCFMSAHYGDTFNKPEFTKQNDHKPEAQFKSNKREIAEADANKFRIKLDNLKASIKTLLNSNLFLQMDPSSHNNASNRSSNSNTNINNNNINNSGALNENMLLTSCKKIPLNLIIKNSNIDLLKCVPTKLEDKENERTNKIAIQKINMPMDESSKHKKLQAEITKQMEKHLNNIEIIESKNRKYIDENCGKSTTARSSKSDTNTAKEDGNKANALTNSVTLDGVSTKLTGSSYSFNGLDENMHQLSEIEITTNYNCMYNNKNPHNFKQPNDPLSDPKSNTTGTTSSSTATCSTAKKQNIQIISTTANNNNNNNNNSNSNNNMNNGNHHNADKASKSENLNSKISPISENLLVCR